MSTFRFYILLIFVSFTACASTQYPISDHYDGKRFYNQDRSVGGGKSFFEVLKWKIFDTAKSWDKLVEDNVKPDLTRSLKKGEGAVTFINHATKFIQLQDINVITDPVFSERASPFKWIGPVRYRRAGVEISQLPKVDVVVISHNHYDHLDLDSLLSLYKKDQPLFIVPLGNRKLLTDIGITNIIELDWWENYSVGSHATITLVPMQHWSARGLFDRSKALWGGYVIESSSLKILFCGDTGYNTHYQQIEKKFGAMDLSIIPIGAYEPRWFMKDSHMNPEDAIQAHLDLKSKLSIGTHYGTFQLTNEGMDDPIEELRKGLQKFKIKEDLFLTPKNGETIFFSTQGRIL